MRRLSPEEKDRIRAALLDGKTVTEAARACGFSRSAANGVAKAMRLEGIGIHRDARGRKPGWNL